jgi:hypothetical protein
MDFPGTGLHRARSRDGRAADLLAAMRFYRDAVAPAFTDDLISAGLSHRPDLFIQGFIANIAQAPQDQDENRPSASCTTCTIPSRLRSR